MTITITLTSAGSDSGPFDIYGNSTGSFVLITSGVSILSLTSGHTILAPDGTTVVRVQSTGTCTNYEDITVQVTTTTVAPTTAAPTTTAAPCYNYEIIAYNDGSGCEGYINYSYYDCNNVYQTGGSVSVGTTQYECARDYPTITCGNGQVSYIGPCGAETTAAPTTTSTTTASAVSVVVGYSDLDNTTACSNYEAVATTKYIPVGEDWQTVTAIYLDPIGTPAQAGYYSDGAKWHYWTESAITSTGFC